MLGGGLVRLALQPGGQSLSPSVTLGIGVFLILSGVLAARERYGLAFGYLVYDFSIWVECEYEQALAQAVARDEKAGESDRVRWELGHAPNQERYIETHRPSEFADMVILLTPEAEYRIVRF